MKRRLMGLDSGPNENTMLLLHFDGNFNDATGNVSLLKSNSSFTTGKYGQAVRCYNTTIDYIKNAIFDFGAADFTVDFWIYPEDNVNYGIMLSNGWDEVGGTNGNSWLIGYKSTNQTIRFCANFISYSQNKDVLISNAILKLGAWTHVAIARRGDQWFMFFDGVLVASATYSGSILPSSRTFHFNGLVNSASYRCIYKIDEFRISNFARWTSNFTPPTKPY